MVSVPSFLTYLNRSSLIVYLHNLASAIVYSVVSEVFDPSPAQYGLWSPGSLL